MITKRCGGVSHSLSAVIAEQRLRRFEEGNDQQAFANSVNETENKLVRKTEENSCEPLWQAQVRRSEDHFVSLL